MDKSFIGVRELADTIGVSEKTIYRMLNDNQFPFAVKIGGQWRFRRDAVDNWIAGQIRNEKDKGGIDYLITIADALQNGTVLYRIHGDNRDEALDAILDTLPHNEGFDHENIKLSVLIRESLASSCLAGIAVMTPSESVPVCVEKSLAILSFLEGAANFKSLDRQPAQVIFLIIGANPTEQLILETRTRRLLMEKMFMDDILQQPGRKTLLQLVKDWEEKLFGSAAL